MAVAESTTARTRCWSSVSLADGARLDPEDLIRFLMPRMAHFMVPRYVRVVDELPKTPTQKVQKRLLRTEGVTADTWDRAAAGIRGEARAHRRDDGAGRGTEGTMTTDAMLIDCDGHILEPPDLWEKYLEPRYRDRAIRIRVGDDAFEYLEIDGKRAVLPRPGQLGNLGGMGQTCRRGAGTCASAPCAARSVPRRCGDPPGPGAHVPAGRRVRHHGHEGARRAPRSRGPGQGHPLSDDRAPVGGRIDGP